MSDALAGRIDALLPQTQCGACGYDGCRPYAEAIANTGAGIDLCPPGGAETLAALAALLAISPPPPTEAHRAGPGPATVVLIDEARCIGCFKCVLACPLDAIIGAPQFMHTVIAEDCSGCGRCLPVCPTDCIEPVPRPPSVTANVAMKARWRDRYAARQIRLDREQAGRDHARQQRRASAMKAQAAAIDIATAVERARARRRALRPDSPPPGTQ